MGTGKHREGSSTSDAPGMGDQAATARGAVESGILKLKAAVRSFGDLVNSIGTPNDSRDLRDQLQHMHEDISLMVKATSTKLEEASALDICSGASANRKTGILAQYYAAVLEEYQRFQSVEGRKTSGRPIITHVSSENINCNGNRPTTHSLRPSNSTSSSAQHRSRLHELTPPLLTRIMEQPKNIRNICMINDIKKVGLTLVKDLADSAASQDSSIEAIFAGAHCDRRITSSDIYLCCELSSKSLKGCQGTYLINIFDSRITSDGEPFHISDGVLVFAGLDGLSPRAEGLLRQAASEGLRPALVIDSIGSLFGITDAEVAYRTLSCAINDVNCIVKGIPGEFELQPDKGNVAFAEGSSWAFTLATFAGYFASTLEITEARMMELLWGDHFYDTKTKEWTTKHTGSPTCKRGFAHFCFEPIKEVFDCCQKGNKLSLSRMLDKYNISCCQAGNKLELSRMLDKYNRRVEGQKNLRGALFEYAMQSWLPARQCTTELIALHLPSPANISLDRLSSLYGGFLDDSYSDALTISDPQGPLMLYISSMYQASAEGSLMAFGRIYSGTISTGVKVRVMGPNYGNRKEDCFVTVVNKTAILMGEQMIVVESVPAGNIVLVLLEESLSCMHSTITNEDSVDPFPIGQIEERDYRLMPLGAVSEFYKLPCEVYRKLAHHQDGALRWFWRLHCEGKGGILGDDMGMGKTRQVSAFILGLFYSKLIKSAMIVVPLTVLTQWVEELEYIGLKDRITEFTSPAVKRQRTSLANAIKDGGVLVTTYGVFSNHKQLIMGSGTECPWDYIFLDEGHKIKNPWAKISSALNNASCKHKFIVTGTPYQNNMKELYALVNFCCPGLLGDRNYFDEVFGFPIDKGKHKDAKPEEIEQAMGAFKKLHSVIGPQMLRRTKKLLQKLGLLKNKHELTIWLKLTEHQAEQYKSLINVRKESSHGSFAALSVAGNICNHPFILQNNPSKGPGGEYIDQILTSDTFVGDLTESSCKVLFTIDLVERLLKENRKILIFSQSCEMLKLIKEALCTKMDGSQIFHMDGNTKPKERVRLVQDFKAKGKKKLAEDDEAESSEDEGECSGDEEDEYSEEYDDEYLEDDNDLSRADERQAKGKAEMKKEVKVPLVFLMSTLVGGMGLNLVTASRVIILDPAKNPSTDNQTVDRVFRFGQSEDVVIYRLISCETVEEHTYRNQIIKGETANSITEGRQCRRGIPARISRVITMPKYNFTRSATHKELAKTYNKEFDKDIAKEVEMIQKGPMVSCITNHSLLFSLEEDRYQPCEFEDDRPEVKKVSRGLSTKPRNVVIGGHRASMATDDSRWGVRRSTIQDHNRVHRSRTRSEGPHGSRWHDHRTKPRNVVIGGHRASMATDDSRWGVRRSTIQDHNRVHRSRTRSEGPHGSRWHDHRSSAASHRED